MAIVGCGGASEAELIASAKTLIEKKDTKAAVIQLKSALQKNPQSAEARFLLGDTLLKGGDSRSAVLELEKAHDLKFSDDEVLPLLAKALVATGQAKKVTDLYGRVSLGDAKAAADLKATVAAAHVSQGQFERGEAALNAALQADPKNTAARLMMARLTAGRNQMDDALAQTQQLLSDEPKLREAWLLKGELLWVGKRDADGGVQALRQALAIDERYVPAHSALAAILLQRRDLEDFRAEVAAMKKALPAHPETRFYDIQAALLDRDLRRAREGSQQLVRMLPDNARVLQLAGAVEMQAGSLLQAQTHLNKALDLSPKLSLARRLLAEIHLRSGNSTKAQAALQPLLDTPQPSAAALALMAESYLQQGDTEKAELFFTRAIKSNPDDTKVRTALALTQISKGDAEAGFTQLEALAKADKETYADLALVSARLRRNESDAALTSLDRLQAKMPDRALPHQLRGQILARRKDLGGARASFVKALSIDPEYFPAIAALADLDVAEKKPADAQKRHADLLAREPGNARASIALAQLRLRAGEKPEQIVGLLGEAVRANPTEPALRLLLVDLHLSRKDIKAASEAAQAAASALPDDPSVLDALGRTQLAAGNTQQAIATFGKAAAAQPNLPQPQLRLADAFMAAKDYERATRSLRRALDISPRLVAAQRGLVIVALASQRPDEALKVARAVQSERPTEPVGWQMMSDVYATQRQWQPAIEAAKGSLDRGKSTDAAIRLHELYLASNRGSEAERFAATWQREQPRDARFLFHLGVTAMVGLDYAVAESRFRQVLAQRPDDAMVLNNVAWLMTQQGKSGALPLAEKAQQLAPEDAQVMDTLASVLAAEGQPAKAIEWQRKAIAKAPDAATYQLNLARLLVKIGDKVAAREELEKLSSLGDKFTNQAEVARLLKTL